MARRTLILILDLLSKYFTQMPDTGALSWDALDGQTQSERLSFFLSHSTNLPDRCSLFVLQPDT